MKQVLLLTGCVNPNGMTFTALQDSKERKKQYVRAINWYLTNTELDIVFVENTNCDLSNEFKDSRDLHRLECLTFDGNNFDKVLGKGYGEALIIKYALNNSLKLREADKIIKITGRLIVHNVLKILKTCKSSNTLYVKEYYQKRMWYKSNFFVTPTSFLKMLIASLQKLNDSKGYYFEHLMYDTAKKWSNENKKIKEIFAPIQIEGQSGSIGYTYSYGIKHTCKEYIRYFLHRIGIYKFN